MKNTKKESTEIVRYLHYYYKRELEKQNLQDTFCNDDFRLSIILSRLTLVRIDNNKYALSTFENAKNVLFPKNTKEHKKFVSKFLIPIIRSISINGLTRTYLFAYDLFNKLFGKINLKTAHS